MAVGGIDSADHGVRDSARAGIRAGGTAARGKLRRLPAPRRVAALLPLSERRAPELLGPPHPPLSRFDGDPVARGGAVSAGGAGSISEAAGSAGSLPAAGAQ